MSVTIRCSACGREPLVDQIDDEVREVAGRLERRSVHLVECGPPCPNRLERATPWRLA